MFLGTMRDADIRQHLKTKLQEKYGNEPGTLILGELGLCDGRARVDMVVVNGEINGFEIKSEYDTLARLPHQVEIYNRVLEKVTIICGKLHLNAIRKLV